MSRAGCSRRGRRPRWYARWQAGARLGSARVPGGRRFTDWWRARRTAGPWRRARRNSWAPGARFSRGDLPARAPGSGGGNGRESVIDSSFCPMYTGPSKPSAGEHLAVRGTERICRRYQQDDRLPNCSSLTDTQRGSAVTLRGEMGLFPFAFTIGTMSTSIPGFPRVRPSRGRCWSGSASWRWPSNPPDRSVLPPASSPPFPQSRGRSSSQFASCFGTARCPDAVARPTEIRGGVSRRTSGQTLSRSARGDRSGAERGPPSGPWSAATRAQ